MISAFGVEHTVSKSFTPKVGRLKQAFRLTHPSESMRERVDTNYLQNRLAAGIGAPYGKASNEGYNWANQQFSVARTARQQTKSWETAANNMNRRNPGTGIGRMEASASRQLAGGKAPQTRIHPGSRPITEPLPGEPARFKPYTPTKRPASVPAPAAKKKRWWKK